LLMFYVPVKTTMHKLDSKYALDLCLVLLL